jgi:PAS domain S-box-containing protein
MNTEIIIKLDDWIKIRKELEVDETVDFSDMFWGKSRDSVVDYAFPHDIVYNKVYLHKSSKPILNISELNGRKVAIQRGSVLEEYLQNNFPGIILNPQTTESEAIRTVSKKLCDAAIVTNASGTQLLQKSTTGNVIGYKNMILPSEYSFVVKKGNTELLKEINTAMALLISSGKVEKLRSKWFEEKVMGIRKKYIKLAIIVLLISLGLSYLLNFILNRKFRIKSLELQRSEERWKFALEGSGDGVWDWNALTNEVYFSKRWKEMLGYNETDIGNTLDEWDKRVHPDEKEQAYADLNKHFDGKTREYINEHRVLCKDGTYKWILDRGKVIERDSNGKPVRVIGTHTDISERKKIEKELYDSRNLLNSIINNSPSLIYISDLEGKIILVNKKLVELFNQPIEKIIGKTREDFMPQENAKEHRKNDLLVISSGNSISIEEENIEPDGKHYYLTEKYPLYDNNNAIFAVGGISTDITERKKTEKEIRQLNEHLELIVKERTKDLESKISEIQRMNKLFVGRELRMKELKEKIIQLENRLSDKTDV